MKPLFRQQGVVLVTTLIMLIVMTLLALALVRSSVIELKIGGASQVVAQNLSNAEAAVLTFMNTDANAGQFYHGNASHLTTNLATVYDTSSSRFSYLSHVTLTATEVACVDYAGVNSGNQLGVETPQAAYFNINAVAQDPVMAGRSVINQGILSIQPPGSCY